MTEVGRQVPCCRRTAGRPRRPPRSRRRARAPGALDHHRDQRRRVERGARRARPGARRLQRGRYAATRNGHRGAGPRGPDPPARVGRPTARRHDHAHRAGVQRLCDASRIERRHSDHRREAEVDAGGVDRAGGGGVGRRVLDVDVQRVEARRPGQPGDLGPPVRVTPSDSTSSPRASFALTGFTSNGAVAHVGCSGRARRRRRRSGSRTPRMPDIVLHAAAAPAMRPAIVVCPAKQHPARAGRRGRSARDSLVDDRPTARAPSGRTASLRARPVRTPVAPHGERLAVVVQTVRVVRFVGRLAARPCRPGRKPAASSASGQAARRASESGEGPRARWAGIGARVACGKHLGGVRGHGASTKR